MKSALGIFLSATVLLYSCSGGFSKGVKKDLGTGLSASYNGFSLEDIFLVSGEDNNKLSNNTVPLGTTVSILATGVEHFKEKDGKVFPGCTILLTDKNGKELLNLPESFSSMKEGTSKEQAATLRAQLNTGAPMEAGTTYHLKARFYDKNNAASEIIANTDLVMK